MSAWTLQFSPSDGSLSAITMASARRTNSVLQSKRQFVVVNLPEHDDSGQQASSGSGLVSLDSTSDNTRREGGTVTRVYQERKYLNE